MNSAVWHVAHCAVEFSGGPRLEGKQEEWLGRVIRVHHLGKGLTFVHLEVETVLVTVTMICYGSSCDVDGEEMDDNLMITSYLSRLNNVLCLCVVVKPPIFNICVASDPFLCSRSLAQRMPRLLWW